MLMQMVTILLMAMAMVMPFTDLWELDAMHPVGMLMTMVMECHPPFDLWELCTL